MPDDDLDALLRFDGLAEAERMTGASYKEDPDTMALGFLMHTAHIDRKRAALEAAKDTHFSMPFAEHLAVFSDIGFEVVLDEPFTGSGGDERFVVLWRPDGVLASCESYGSGRSANSSHVHYNWRLSAEVLVNEGRDWWALVSSGGPLCDGVWPGDHDAREGLAHKLAALAENGEFLPRWVRRPSLHLLTYAEWRQVDALGGYAALREARISRLPARVRDAIGEGVDV